MCGLVYSGVSRLDYDAAVDGGRFPVHVESTTDAAVAEWMERVIHLVPVGPRPSGYGPLDVQRLDPDWVRRLSASGRSCYAAIVAGDLRALADAFNETSRAWAAILPHVFEHPTIAVDIRGLLASYAAEYPGAMMSGCGGGYVVVASEAAPPGSTGITVRLA
jgi:hypothetical protein